MILLKKISLSNFLSHSNTTIEFRDSQKLIITGKSGSGKSGIIESILYALYNQGRGNSKFLIKKGASQASVTLLLFCTTTLRYYKITRRIDDKNKHDVTVLEGDDLELLSPIKATGVREIQDFIDKEIVHASYLLFINSVLYPQNSSESFIYQTANRRKDIILEIANTENYDLYYTKAKSLLTAHSSKISEIKSIITEKEFQIAEARESSSNLRELNDEKEKILLDLELVNSKIITILQEKERLNKSMVLINSNKDKLSELSLTIDTNDRKVVAIQNKIKELDNVNKSDLEEKVKFLGAKKLELKDLDDSKDKYFAYKDELNKLLRTEPTNRDFDLEINEVNKQLIDIMKIPVDSCPQCGFVSPELQANHQARIKYLEDRLGSLSKSKLELDEEKRLFQIKLKEVVPVSPIDSVKYAELSREIVELEKLERQLVEMSGADGIKRGLNEQIQSIEAEQINLKNKKIGIEIELKDSAVYSDMFKDTCNTLMQAESQKSILTTHQMYNHGKLAVAQASFDSIEKNLKLLEEIKNSQKQLFEDVDKLTLVKEAFSANGIKSIVIDMLIPRLEDTINNTLEKLSDFRIKFDTQKSGSGKDTVLEGLFISVINAEGEELNIENMSGGESVKISSAIFEGLASISNCGFRIMDETIVGLDQETTSSFVDIMLQLQKNVSQLICVSHLTEVQEIFNEKIEIVKINGESKVI